MAQGIYTRDRYQVFNSLTDEEVYRGPDAYRASRTALRMNQHSRSGIDEVPAWFVWDAARQELIA